MSNETATKPLAQQSFRFGWRLLGGCGVGAMLAVCFPPMGLYFLLPFGVAGLLALLHGLGARQAFYVGMACGTVWFCGDLFWIARLFGTAALSLCALLALFPALFGALFAWLNRRLPQVPAWLLAPVLWTGIEYYRSELFVLKFGWLGLGYGVVNAPLLAHGASWAGCYGLSFAIVLMGAILFTLFAMLANANAVSAKRKIICSAGLLLAGWLALCLIRLPAPPPVHPLRVRLIQANSEDEESFYSLSRPLPGQAPDVIVWPEYSFVSDPYRTPKLWPKIKQVAQENHAYLLFGAKDQFDPNDEAGFRNTAFLLDPDGKEIARHVKNHPVHFIRDGVAGTQARAIVTPLGRLGVAICFDMDYPDVARRLAQDGATVFLVPNDDPPEWGPIQRVQHRLLFQMRAVECGRWLGRADVAGGTSVSAPNGQEVARVTTRQPTALDATLGRETAQTWYARGGWRFGPLCLPASIVLCGVALLRGILPAKRQRMEQP